MKHLLIILLLLISGAQVASPQALSPIDTTATATLGQPILYSPDGKAMTSQIEQMKGKLKEVDNNSHRRHIAVSSKLENLSSSLDTVSKNLDSIGKKANALEQMLLLTIQKMDTVISKTDTLTQSEHPAQNRSVLPILSLLAGLLTLGAMAWGYRKLRGEMSRLHEQEDHNLSPQNKDVSWVLDLLKTGLNKSDGISESVATSLSSLSRQENTMTKVASQLEAVLKGQDNAELIEKLEALLSRVNEIKESIAKLPPTNSLPAKISPSIPQRDVVVYNAAVDAWLHINNQLFSMGKWRWKIQNVYRLLAGLDVSEDDLRSDLQGLGDDERRESVLTIINDIKRFMATHKPVIDEWLQGENEAGIKSLQDAVWMSQGMPFNDDRDEEVTGDDVEEGTIVDKVASLGYYFPGSRNGGILQKCKVLVATD